MKSIDLVIGITAGILLAAYAANADITSSAQPADVPVNSPDPSIPYGERVAANDFYDADYDGAYGAFADGYWGKDGQFWYEGGTASSIFAPDTAGHFRRTPAPGFALVRGTGVQREN